MMLMMIMTVEKSFLSSRDSVPYTLRGVQAFVVFSRALWGSFVWMQPGEHLPFPRGWIDTGHPSGMFGFFRREGRRATYRRRRAGWLIGFS